MPDYHGKEIHPSHCCEEDHDVSVALDNAAIDLVTVMDDPATMTSKEAAVFLGMAMISIADAWNNLSTTWFEYKELNRGK